MLRVVLLATFWLFAFTAGPSVAQDPGAEARIRADVGFLASDLLEGRETGRRGYEVAAAYVQSRMEALGLRPGGADQSWRQTVRFVRTSTPSGVLTWSPRDGEQIILRNGRDGAFGRALDGGAVEVSGGAVFVGYGLSLPGQGRDDYAGLDVSGKVVVVVQGGPLGERLDQELTSSQGKAALAQAHGAVGLIIVNTEASAAVFDAARLGRMAARTQIDWVFPDGRVNRAYHLPTVHLNDAAAARLFDGAPRSYADIQAQGPGDAFELPGEAALEVETLREDFSGDNVIGLIPGSDPSLRHEHVILTAHLDHIGLSPSGDDRINNGALDNAGGVATLLEAARILQADPPRRSVLIVALAAEEWGLFGSEYLARHPVVPATDVAANINLDMPILTYDFTDIVAFGGERSTLGPLVERAAATEALTVSPDPMPEQGVFTRSDHFSFVMQGVPSVMLATGYANGGEAAWSAFFSNGYHKPGDDLSQDFHWPSAARFARVNAAIARAVADADARPLWYAGDPFADEFAPDRPRAPAPR